MTQISNLQIVGREWADIRTYWKCNCWPCCYIIKVGSLELNLHAINNVLCTWNTGMPLYRYTHITSNMVGELRQENRLMECSRISVRNAPQHINTCTTATYVHTPCMCVYRYMGTCVYRIYMQRDYVTRNKMGGRSLDLQLLSFSVKK